MFRRLRGFENRWTWGTLPGFDLGRPSGVCVIAVLSPLGLAHLPLGTHTLRCGLHSCAASRLSTAALLHFFSGREAMTQTPPGLSHLFHSSQRGAGPSWIAPSGLALCPYLCTAVEVVAPDTSA